MAEDRHRRHRPLCARRDRAQRRVADRLGRRRRVLRLLRRQRARARRALRRHALGHHAGRALLDRDAVRSRRPPGPERGGPLRLHQPGNRAPAPTAASRSWSRRARGPATGCRPAASTATSWCCASTTRRSASRRAPPRMRRCPPSRRGAAHDPLAALAARRAAARRHRASGERAAAAAHRDAGRLHAPRRRRAGEQHRAAARPDAGRRGAAVHGSGLRHRGLPLRSRGRAAQAARAGEPGLHVGVVLHAATASPITRSTTARPAGASSSST